ncbi:MAG: phosphoadenosine phosphosulfate reductase family protein [Thermotogota bacterium]|nr:phosphoadenosine phosphosulfate reductase family protein [Thermotogota bacterium]
MQIETIEFKNVKRASYNPRADLKPGTKKYEKLKKCIMSYGHVLPLVYNSRTGNLVGGHQSMTVLEDLGHTEAKMSIVDLSEDEEKSLNLALNKLGGEWDDDKLSLLLGDLITTKDFDLDLTGFEKFELKSLDIDLDIPDLDTAIDTLTIDYDPGAEPTTEPQQRVSNAKKREAKREVKVDEFDIYSIAFSGGKDSTLLALWALERLPPEKIYLKYWDSGWNYKEETKYVYYFAEKYGLNLILAGYKNNQVIIDNMIKHGYPFYGNLWCQSRLKASSLNDVHKYIQENISDKVLSLVGIRKSESQRRADYPEFSKMGGETIWFPIRDFSDEDLIAYFIENGEKVTPLYKFTDRTGCVFCPNANVSARQYLKEHHPEELIKINECIIEALKNKRWAAEHLIDTLKVFNKKRIVEPKDYFKEIAFTPEEFDAIEIDMKKINILDLRK